jgi:molybdopterin converting factor small subunit
MSVKILYFAASKDASGTPEEYIDLATINRILPGSTSTSSSSSESQVSLQDLLNYILDQHPNLTSILDTAMVALNMEYVQRERGWLKLDADTVPAESQVWVKAGDEVAIIPPVSGG